MYGAPRFDNTADYLSRTANLLNYNLPYTVSMWAWLSLDLDDYGHFYSVCDQATEAVNDYWNSDFFGLDADGTTLRLGAFIGAVGATTTGASLTIGRWYHLAVVRYSATDLRMLLNGAQTGSTVTQNIAGRAAVAGEFLGRFNGGFPFSGRIAAFKAWQAGLTFKEIRREMRQYDAFRRGGLHTVAPFFFTPQSASLRNYRPGTGFTLNGTITSEPGPWIPWRLEKRLVVKAPAAGQTVAIGLVTETDSALALSGRKTKALGLNSETDTALALTAEKALTLGLASETDNALAVTSKKTVTLGLAAETDAALTLQGSQVVAIGQASETDSSLPLTGHKTAAIGLVSEADSALTLTGKKTLAIGLASEIDTSFPVVEVKSLALGLASETDTALRFALLIGQAVEADQALPLVISVGAAGPMYSRGGHCYEHRSVASQLYEQLAVASQLYEHRSVASQILES